MEAEEERKTHDQVFSYKCPAILKWIYHKLHICMCIEQPKKLLMSQWPITPLAWLNYRITMAVISIMILVFNFASTALFHQDIAKIAKFFIYFTNWGLIVLAISFTSKAYIALKYFHLYASDSELTHVPTSFIFSWITTNISNTIAFGVTGGYWVIVYDGSLITDPTPINSHVINSVITLLDLFMSEIPVHFAHFYQPFYISCMYILFNYVYYVSGNTNERGKNWIYPSLKWDTITLQAVLTILVGGSVVCVVLHALTVLISWIRWQIAKLGC